MKTQALKPYKIDLKEIKTQHMYITTSQRPHVGVHSSTGHSPGVHNQVKENEY